VGQLPSTMSSSVLRSFQSKGEINGALPRRPGHALSPSPYKRPLNQFSRVPVLEIEHDFGQGTVLIVPIFGRPCGGMTPLPGRNETQSFKKIRYQALWGPRLHPHTRHPVGRTLHVLGERTRNETESFGRTRAQALSRGRLHRRAADPLVDCRRVHVDLRRERLCSVA
jgi:hypothetical protein